jgi:hypothetical protein
VGLEISALPKIFWMSGYNIREGKYKAYKSFLNSKAFKRIWAEVEEETGVRYVETYFTIIPSSHEAGDYEVYQIWELPDHAAMDKMRRSAAVSKLFEASHGFAESKPSKSVLLRKASDVKILFEPEK